MYEFVFKQSCIGITDISMFERLNRGGREVKYKHINRADYVDAFPQKIKTENALLGS